MDNWNKSGSGADHLVRQNMHIPQSCWLASDLWRSWVIWEETVLPVQPQLDIESSTLATQTVNPSSSSFSSLLGIQRLAGPVVIIHFCTFIMATEDVWYDIGKNVGITFWPLENVVALGAAPACDWVLSAGQTINFIIQPAQTTSMLFLLQKVFWGKPVTCWPHLLSHKTLRRNVTSHSVSVSRLYWCDSGEQRLWWPWWP